MLYLTSASSNEVLNYNCSCQPTTNILLESLGDAEDLLEAETPPDNDSKQTNNRDMIQLRHQYEQFGNDHLFFFAISSVFKKSVNCKVVVVVPELGVLFALKVVVIE